MAKRRMLESIFGYSLPGIETVACSELPPQEIR
jgi:hypothetical protein